MKLIEFNQCSVDVATSVLKPCAHIASWINTLIVKRPFGDVEQLYETAEQQAKQWQWQEVVAALALHPRIGQRQAAKALSDKEQQFSAQEQGAVSPDQAIQRALLQGNLDYEQQFGHIFLIRAAGRSTEDILRELQRRMSNSVQQERQEVCGQLAEIALLRLKQEIVA